MEFSKIKKFLPLNSNTRFFIKDTYNKISKVAFSFK